MPTDSDLTSWNSLTGSDAQLETTYVQVGLFSFDLTGFVTDCKASYYDIRMCDIFDLAGFDGWSVGVLGVVDVTNSENRYWYGVGVTDTYAGVLFPTYGSYADDSYYAGAFYYYYGAFDTSQPDISSVIYCYTNMETYYGADSIGMFSSYVLGYYYQGAYYTYAWRFMNEKNNGDDSHF